MAYLRTDHVAIDLPSRCFSAIEAIFQSIRTSYRRSNSELQTLAQTRDTHSVVQTLAALVNCWERPAVQDGDCNQDK